MLVSREFTFSGAHNLPDYQGKCEKLHGHTWRLRVTVKAPVAANGLSFDFQELGQVVNDKVISVLDHSHINEQVPQASAERIAQWIWDRLTFLPLFEVRVWESEKSFVTYHGEGDDG